MYADVSVPEARRGDAMSDELRQALDELKRLTREQAELVKRLVESVERLTAGDRR